MGFISRLLGRQEPGLSTSSKAVHPATKRQQPSSPASGSFATDCFGTRPAPASPVKIQSPPQVELEQDSDDEETIHVPRPVMGDRGRSNSCARRRAAIDISPSAVQRLADKVTALEERHYRTSLDGDLGNGITHTEIEQLYTDMQLIHRGRSSMIYRAREVRTGNRVILKAFDTARLTPTKRQNLDRQIRALKAAVYVLGPQGGVVALERVVENPSGVFLVQQSCNGGTLIEAIANSGGKLPERQVAIKIALPMLRALARLHARGIVHRDIKPEHLMIHNGNLKMGDFGSAGCMSGAVSSAAGATAAANGNGLVAGGKQHQQSTYLALDDLSQQQQHSLGKANGNPAAVSLTVAAGSGSGLCVDTSGHSVRDAMNFRTGSIEYMAPEMLDKPTSSEVFHLVISQGIDEDELPAYDQKVDIWSLGVVMYEALSGVQPFLADNAAEMAAVINTKLAQKAAPAPGGQFQPLPAFIARLPVTADGKDFIASCLTANPKQRPSAEQLLEHRWLVAMQEQAAAAAASRAASRRVSRSSFCYSNAHAGYGIASPAGPAEAAAAAAAAAAAFKEQAAAVVVRADSSGPLMDQLLSNALRNHPLPGEVPEECRQSSLELDSGSFSRSQTDINLEVGIRTVYRSNTQRLEMSRPLAAHVHGPT